MKDIKGAELQAYKRVCPLKVQEFEWDEAGDNRIMSLVDCHADLHLLHRTMSDCQWWVRDGVVEPMTLAVDEGDDWWQLECENGHVLLQADPDVPVPFDPAMLDDLGCPTMHSVDFNTWAAA